MGSNPRKQSERAGTRNREELKAKEGCLDERDCHGTWGPETPYTHTPHCSMRGQEAGHLSSGLEATPEALIPWDICPFQRTAAGRGYESCPQVTPRWARAPVPMVCYGQAQMHTNYQQKEKEITASAREDEWGTQKWPKSKNT